MSVGPRADAAGLPALRWFGAADVLAAMPSIDERLALAERTLTALATPSASELPPKIGVHPRPEGSFGHAMPAHLRARTAAEDLLGLKWVTGVGSNSARGLPAISAIVVLNDPETGVPVALLDGGPITAQRTAAISGVALRHFGPAPTPGLGVALIGAGLQGRAHLPVVGAVLPDAILHLHDRHPERAANLAAEARSTPGIGGIQLHDSARDAIESADVVITAAAFTSPDRRQVMTNAWLREGATVVPVDYATYCAAEVARDAALFLVDDRGQFLANRDAGNFDGYPDPAASIGEAILGGMPRPAGRVVLTHLGVGLADVVFADVIARAAIAAGGGTTLRR